MMAIDKIGLIASGFAMCVAMVIEYWALIPFFIASAYFFGWVKI